MKKFLAVFMAALMAVAVFAAPAGAMVSAQLATPISVETVQMDDIQLQAINGGWDGWCAAAGGAAILAISGFTAGPIGGLITTALYAPSAVGLAVACYHH